jgi:hypothetical protein
MKTETADTTTRSAMPVILALIVLAIFAVASYFTRTPSCADLVGPEKCPPAHVVARR